MPLRLDDSDVMLFGLCRLYTAIFLQAEANEAIMVGVPSHFFLSRPGLLYTRKNRTANRGVKVSFEVAPIDFGN